MPLYSFINIETGEEHEALMKFSERDQYLLDNPHLTPKVTACGFVSGIGVKPDDGFRDLLRQMKKGSGRGNTINTF